MEQPIPEKLSQSPNLGFEFKCWNLFCPNLLLVKRIEQLEQRVQELEEKLTTQSSPVPAEYVWVSQR